MIDTIVLRIHDLQKYQKVCDFILSDRKGTSQGVAYEKEMTALRFQYLHFTDTNSSRMMYRSYIKTPSHNYDVTIALIQFRDYIEISFSIPKYLYGTNVMMFTKHHDEKYLIDMTEEQDLRKIFEYTFKMLSTFIRSIFDRLFPENHGIDLRDVELKRLDLCFNQVFQSEHDAKMYLMYQKMIKKKGARQLSESKQTYETSIFYSTEYYAAKIYHKGTEYRKHDKLKHLAANKKYGYEHFPIDDKGGVLGIESVSDRILRYEISFKKSFMQYYYWRYYYRKDVESVKKKKLIHRKMTNEMVNIDRTVDLEKKKVLLSEYRKKWTKPYEHVRRDVQRLYDFAPIFMILPSRDMIDEMSMESDFYDGKHICVGRRQLFSKFLYNQMVHSFMEFYENFQVKEKVYFHDAMRRIADFNDKAEVLTSAGHKTAKMYRGSMEKINLLLQHYSIDELKTLNILPKRTFYEWKKRLKAIGIENTNVATISIPVSNGKEMYHETINLSRLACLIKSFDGWL